MNKIKRFLIPIILIGAAIMLLGAAGESAVNSSLSIGGSTVTDTLVLGDAKSDTLVFDTLKVPPEYYSKGYIYVPFLEVTSHDAGDMICIRTRSYIDSVCATHLIASDSQNYDNQDNSCHVDTMRYVGIANVFEIMIIGTIDDADDTLAMGPPFYTLISRQLNK
jgi:hypothetical protein